MHIKDKEEVAEKNPKIAQAIVDDDVDENPDMQIEEEKKNDNE